MKGFNSNLKRSGREKKKENEEWENFMILVITWGQLIIGANIKQFYG